MRGAGKKWDRLSMSYKVEPEPLNTIMDLILTGAANAISGAAKTSAAFAQKQIS